MNKGFTLVELIAVVTILALLAVITTPAYETISKSVRENNYESKMESIKAQTLSYVEKYMKDKVYDGTKHNYCFTAQFLIQNGIINSDDEREDYIKNDITDKKYKGADKLVLVYYDTSSLKLRAKENIADGDCDVVCHTTCTP